MMHPRALSLALVALLVTACGGSATTTTSGAATTSPPETSSTTTTTEAETTTTVGGPIVLIHEATGECAEDMAVTAIERTIPEDADPITTAFELQLAALAGEEAPQELVRSATVTDGLLTVDFVDLRSVLDNASTTCGMFALLAVLQATAFQFPEVEQATFQLEGSCSDFEVWLQRGEDCPEYAQP
ncbi:MAG: hypothetical protein AB1Z57_01035 [Acidimicrobiia bacterium]